MDHRRQALHRRFNAETRNAWRWFASHRLRVTEHLVSCGGQTLAVWGAGNCNDLDLPRLLAHFERITLYDLDRDAMAAGVERQLPEGGERISLVEADAVTAAADDPLPRHDVVASLCLLSQILLEAQLQAADTGTDPWTQIETLRSNHLRLLLRTASPGGWSLLFNDFLSSDTCSTLATCDDSQLVEALGRELARANFFTGLHPLAIETAIKQSPALRGLAAGSDVTSPWRWNLGPKRCYAVCLHRMRPA